MARDTVRSTAERLRDLPLPIQNAQWRAAADVVEDLHRDTDPDRERVKRLRLYAQLSTAAFGIDDTVLVEWWLGLCEQNWARRASRIGSPAEM